MFLSSGVVHCGSVVTIDDVFEHPVNPQAVSPVSLGVNELQHRNKHQTTKLYLPMRSSLHSFVLWIKLERKKKH